MMAPEVPTPSIDDVRREGSDDTTKGRRFAIPDIHGCARTLQRLLETTLGVKRGDRLYLLGDYVDRGPDSKGVLDLLMEMPLRGVSVFAVRGNHEVMLLRAGTSLDHFRLWMLNGGEATLASFGIEHPTELPQRYRTFLAALPYFITTPDFIFVHAGINFAAPLPFADLEAMIWSRHDRVDPLRSSGRKVVCGHTPHNREEIREALSQWKIVLDNGCVYHDVPAYGCLAALDLDTLELFFQRNVDPIPATRRSGIGWR